MAATDRAEPGHWEGDLITGAGNRSAVGTVVERSSRFTVLLHLPGRHTAEAVRDVGGSDEPAPRAAASILTWDQGAELALHAEIAQILGMPVVFCEKASPWQRPSNENTNGLLRQYFPKGSDLSVHSPEQLTAVAAELNDDRAGPSAGPAQRPDSPRCCALQPADPTVAALRG